MRRFTLRSSPRPLILKSQAECYASPEQLRGESIDRRTDIYSTGTMAYEMCSGRRPFEGENNSLTTIILKVVSEPPPPMNVPWSRSFPEIERIVNRAMAKSREDRYQTAEDMKNAFGAFLASSRDLITVINAQDTVTAQRTVIEAQGLIAAGKPGDAQTLLSQTLKVNPTANAIRQFLDELNTLPPLVFGLYPAIKAAALEPVDAMRYE